MNEFEIIKQDTQLIEKLIEQNKQILDMNQQLINALAAPPVIYRGGEDE